MANHDIIESFLADIKCKFPEVAPLMEQHEDFMLTSKMETFAALTTQAFNEGALEKAIEYLNYITARLQQANDKEFEYIDVYYVEHLFWGGTEQGIKAGWPLVPQALKKLYLNFHRKEPAFFK